MSNLTRQLLYSPAEVRAQLVEHAEALHDELDPAKNYPIDFVVYRLTDRRVPPSESVMLVGEAIKPDLRLLIDTLSRSTQMPVDADDPGMTTAELARSLDVSTKTIARWRDRGLRWRWGMRSGQPAVLITRAGLEAFDQSQTGRVTAASAFTRLSQNEKAKLISRARRLVQATGAKQQAVLTHLAKRSGRSLEALRQLVQDHDQTHPEAAVFAGHTGPLTDEQKAAIAKAYNNGSTVTLLCKQYGKTRSTIYRAIHDGRARQLAAMTISVVHSPIFERDDADEVLMQAITKQGHSRHLGPDVIGALPAPLKSIYDTPIKSDDALRSLIVRYNFLKYRARQLQQRIGQAPPRASDLDQFDDLVSRIDSARGEVIAAVLPIALSVVRRQQTGDGLAKSAGLYAMLHIAQRVLIEQIDLYDASVSHTFESVLTNRLLRVLAGPITIDDALDAAALIEQLAEAGYSPP